MTGVLRMWCRTLAGIAAVLLCMTAADVRAIDASAADGRSTTRVLFVGNSHTATHALPDVVARLARQEGIVLEVEMLAEPGYSLGDHLSRSRLQAVLQEVDWDWLVLQQGPSSLPESRADLRRSVTTIADQLRGRPVRIALLSVWPDRRHRASSLAAEESYRQAAAAIDACVLPAATAWRLADSTEGAPRLYQRDQLHATQAGTVLAALTIALGLSGDNTSGQVPIAGDAAQPASADELQLLRTLATRAHRAEPRRCVAAPPTPATGTPAAP